MSVADVYGSHSLRNGELEDSSNQQIHLTWQGQHQLSNPFVCGHMLMKAISEYDMIKLSHPSYFLAI